MTQVLKKLLKYYRASRCNRGKHRWGKPYNDSPVTVMGYCKDCPAKYIKLVPRKRPF